MPVFRPRVGEREMLARGLERVVIGPEGRGAIRTLYPLVRPNVARAVAPTFARVANVLRDDRRRLPAGALAAVRATLTDGVNSPLYGTDVDAAATAAAALEQAVLLGDVRLAA